MGSLDLSLQSAIDGLKHAKPWLNVTLGSLAGFEIGPWCVRNVLLFSNMTTSATMSVREQLAACPVGTFIWSRELAGVSTAVEMALSRIAAEEHSPIVRVRKGLYWRTTWTRFGPTRPTERQIAIKIAGPGSGPAGVAAAHDLGLTTQVPSVDYIAVPGRPPRPIRGVRFLSRQYHRRELGLRALEVAVLEALRAGPGVVEVDWSELVKRIRVLVEAGHLRVDVLSEAAAKEFDLDVRRKFSALEQELEHATT
jgi:hypothetical protein